MTRPMHKQPSINPTSSATISIFQVIIVALVFTWSSIDPHDGFTWFLETASVMIGIPLLILIGPRFRFTQLVCWLIVSHAIILMIGGHYTHEHVPPFDWLRDVLDQDRNHYDRVGHLAQGFVPAMIAREIIIRRTALKRGLWLFVFVTAFCLGFSAFYELVEWGVALATSEAAEAFLGTQGDVWDTQADMSMALVGALLAQLSLNRYHDRLLKPVMQYQASD
jgi:putative membrane protein